jgi:hypothetical protein
VCVQCSALQRRPPSPPHILTTRNTCLRCSRVGERRPASHHGPIQVPALILIPCECARHQVVRASICPPPKERNCDHHLRISTPPDIDGLRSRTTLHPARRRVSSLLGTLAAHILTIPPALGLTAPQTHSNRGAPPPPSLRRIRNPGQCLPPRRRMAKADNRPPASSSGDACTRTRPVLRATWSPPPRARPAPRTLHSPPDTPTDSRAQ